MERPFRCFGLRQLGHPGGKLAHGLSNMCSPLACMPSEPSAHRAWKDSSPALFTLKDGLVSLFPCIILDLVSQ